MFRGRGKYSDMPLRLKGDTSFGKAYLKQKPGVLSAAAPRPGSAMLPLTPLAAFSVVCFPQLPAVPCQAHGLLLSYPPFRVTFPGVFDFSTQRRVGRSVTTGLWPETLAGIGRGRHGCRPGENDQNAVYFGSAWTPRLRPQTLSVSPP
jgi:hypothetical protein